MEGNDEKLDVSAYIYHDRIFKRWGSQVNRAIELLIKQPNTKRCLISLWDPKIDQGNSEAPRLESIWFVIRGENLEMYATYRNYHLATVSKEGKLMDGEGEFVQNLYALGTLLKLVAKKVQKQRGPLILNDYSGFLLDRE